MSTLAFDPEETTHWEKVRPRKVSDAQWKKFEGYASEIFEAFGMDLDTPGTRATPSRYLRALFESTAGYEGDPKLLTAFPHEEIIGISKLSRLVRVFARRFTVQERVGVEIADELVRVLKPHGVAVHLNATHLCTQMRGVREGHSRTWTSFWRGNYESNPQLRTEFLQSVNPRIEH
ncbi:MAG: hypothetical protein E6H99_08735 [Chloroflexi bacterium]|nr:MAG: hypothetical protein E6H99_08735 [Chloroflexota bacterium]